MGTQGSTVRTEADSTARVRGIDSLRFVAAMWVAFGHGAWIPARQLLQGTGSFGQLISAAIGVMFNGVAAVIVFFVISGFCIHLPYVGAERIALREYFIRRYLRTGGPLVAILLIGQLWSDPAGRAVHQVLWTVYCELAYYTLYPPLFVLFRRYRLWHLIAVATAISSLLIVTHWSYLRQWEFGTLAFLVAYPPWLLGCLLADKLKKAELTQSKVSIWYWRGGAWLYSVLSEIAVFHSPIRIGYSASLLLFSFYCYFWLQQELLGWRTRAPLHWLESAGGWSFSVYLVHKIVITEFVELRLPISPLLNWALLFAAVLGVSYLFYLVIERPAHAAARRWARSLRRPAAPECPRRRCER
jgi:peptidoglycan/LPS O-acetylase OafA/YrhL